MGKDGSKYTNQDCICKLGILEMIAGLSSKKQQLQLTTHWSVKYKYVGEMGDPLKMTQNYLPPLSLCQNDATLFSYLMAGKFFWTMD